MGRKDLILEITVIDSRTLDQLGNLLRFRYSASQRFLARNAFELAFARSHGVCDLFDILDTCLIGSAEPDRVDGGIGDHGRDRVVGFGVANVAPARQSRGIFRMLLVGAEDA